MAKVTTRQLRPAVAEQQKPQSAILWRFGDRAGVSRVADLGDDKVRRQSSGLGLVAAPAIVGEVLRHSGIPLPDGIRRDMEQRFDHNFADVRVHTDTRAAESARAVQAQAYTVGRSIVFDQGRFAPGSQDGRNLIAHELAHAAETPRGGPLTSGDLYVSTPRDSGERRAEQRSAAALKGGPGMSVQPPPGPAPQMLSRQPAQAVALTAATINHDRVTVPPGAGLTLTAGKTPANATGVTFSLVGDTAAIATGTTINASSGAITVAAAQTGGRAHAEAEQTITAPDGSTTTNTASSPALNFTAIPAGIASTSGVLRNVTGFYGGDFTHTFSPPSGSNASALERARVNERFAAASGTTLTITGTLGTLNVTINDPTSTTGGWDLDSSGIMLAPDHVTWAHGGIDARPFVVNASNRTPANTLPQALTANQTFRNLTFPARTWGTAVVGSTTHRRAIEERSNRLKAVTSTNPQQEVVEDYAGPTVFRRCRANPASVTASAVTPSGGQAATPNTTTVQVDSEGEVATPSFSIQGAALGCTIDATTGVLTVGTTPGSVTVRGGGASNFDETTVTITPRAPAPSPNPAPTP